MAMRKVIHLEPVPNSPNKWYAELLLGDQVLDVARGYPRRVMSRIHTWQGNDDAELKDGELPEDFIDDWRNETWHVEGAR